MQEALVTFPTAKLAKEKGFKWGTSKGYCEDGILTVSQYASKCYNDSEDYPTKYSAPTQSLLQKWLREVHNLHLYIDTTPSFEQMESHKSKYKISIKVPFSPFKWTTGRYYLGNTYEEALEIGLQEALKLIK